MCAAKCITMAYCHCYQSAGAFELCFLISWEGSLIGVSGAYVIGGQVLVFLVLFVFVSFRV